jgi:hypothetical protein
VVVLSLIKKAGRENESWNSSAGWVTGWVNFMVIQWNGDFAERKFVGKVTGRLAVNESSGKDYIFVLGRYLFRDVNCHWKTIRLI